MLFKLALNNTEACTATAPARWRSLLCAWLPEGDPTYQHGLHWGHEWGLHTQGLLQPWHLLSLLLVLQHPLHHILQVPWGLECLVGVGIQSIQPAWREGTLISLRAAAAASGNEHFWVPVTHTCFAPAFIFKSCLMSLMMHFRSLPVHLEKIQQRCELNNFLQLKRRNSSRSL